MNLDNRFKPWVHLLAGDEEAYCGTLGANPFIKTDEEARVTCPFCIEKMKVASNVIYAYYNTNSPQLGVNLDQKGLDSILRRAEVYRHLIFFEVDRNSEFGKALRLRALFGAHHYHPTFGCECMPRLADCRTQVLDVPWTVHMAQLVMEMDDE